MQMICYDIVCYFLFLNKYPSNHQNTRSNPAFFGSCHYDPQCSYLQLLIHDQRLKPFLEFLQWHFFLRIPIH